MTIVQQKDVRSTAVLIRVSYFPPFKLYPMMTVYTHWQKVKIARMINKMYLIVIKMEEYFDPLTQANITHFSILSVLRFSVPSSILECLKIYAFYCYVISILLFLYNYVYIVFIISWKAAILEKGLMLEIKLYDRFFRASVCKNTQSCKSRTTCTQSIRCMGPQIFVFRNIWSPYKLHKTAQRVNFSLFSGVHPLILLL